MRFVLFLHVLAAIFLIGPLVGVVMASPRAIRAGTEAVATLRWLTRTTRLYGLLSLVVFALGLAVVPLTHGRHAARFGQFWLSSSMTLYVVAVGLLFVVQRDQMHAIRDVETGEKAPVRAGRVAAVGGASTLLWAAIVLLMVYRPGE